MKTHVEYAMKVLVPLMKKGKMYRYDATKALYDAKACSLTTLERAGAVWVLDGYVYTPERVKADNEERDRQKRIKELRAMMKAMEKELETLKKA
jgi:RPA family protein